MSDVMIGRGIAGRGEREPCTGPTEVARLRRAVPY